MSDIKTVDIIIDAEYEEYIDVKPCSAVKAEVEERVWCDFICNVYLLLCTYECDIIEDTDFYIEGPIPEYRCKFRVKLESGEVVPDLVVNLDVKRHLGSGSVKSGDKVYWASKIYCNDYIAQDFDVAWNYLQHLLEDLFYGNDFDETVRKLKGVEFW